MSMLQDKDSVSQTAEHNVHALIMELSNGIYIVKTYGRKVRYIYHWAVLVVKDNEKYVYHNSFHNPINPWGGSIAKESWDSFTKKYEPIDFIRTDLTENEVLERTNPLLHKMYQRIFFNCNDYVMDVAPQYTPMAQEKYFYIGIIAIAIIAAASLIKKNEFA